jgi:hypothetical protein
LIARVVLPDRHTANNNLGGFCNAAILWFQTPDLTQRTLLIGHAFVPKAALQNSVPPQPTRSCDEALAVHQPYFRHRQALIMTGSAARV